MQPKFIPNSFYEVSIFLISKLEKKKKNQKRELLANISDERRCKTPQKNTNKTNLTIH